MKKRILVTGGTGFIGSHLIKELLKKENFIIRIFIREESNLTRLENLIEKIEIFKGDFYNINDLKKSLENVDILIHLAAILGRGFDEEYKKFNVEVSKNLFNFALKQNVKKIIFLSSLSVMGGSKKPFIYTEEIKPNPISSYAKSKLEVENYLLKISKKFKNNSFIILRAPAVYGPDDNFDRGFIRIIDMIAKKNFPVIGNLDNFMSLVYVYNLIDAIILLCKKNLKGLHTYFVADNEILTTGEIYKFICKELNISKSKIYLPYKLAKFIENFIEFIARVFHFLPSFPENWVYDITSNYACSIKRIKKELGWKPKFTIYEGLKETIEWYKREYAGGGI